MLGKSLHFVIIATYSDSKRMNTRVLRVPPFIVLQLRVVQLKQFGSAGWQENVAGTDWLKVCCTLSISYFQSWCISIVGTVIWTSISKICFRNKGEQMRNKNRNLRKVWGSGRLPHLHPPSVLVHLNNWIHVEAVGSNVNLRNNLDHPSHFCEALREYCILSKSLKELKMFCHMHTLLDVLSIYKWEPDLRGKGDFCRID